MSGNLKAPDTLYHFTSPMGLAAILHAKHIALTESNLNIREGNCGVVWLTSSQNPKSHGLKFDDTIPSELDKTQIRIMVRYKSSFKLWDEWSNGKGMDKDYKEILIVSAGAKETYKTWYISETKIPAGEFLEIVNLATGKTISVDDAQKSLPDTKMPEVQFRNEIDGYIASRPANLQVMLLNVRMAIRQAIPDATEKISYQMPTFWQGRNLIHFAAQKNHLGIYPGVEAIKHFALRLADYKTSKGAIQFPYKSFGAEQVKLIAEIAAWTATACRRGKENDE